MGSESSKHEDKKAVDSTGVVNNNVVLQPVDVQDTEVLALLYIIAVICLLKLLLTIYSRHRKDLKKRYQSNLHLNRAQNLIQPSYKMHRELEALWEDFQIVFNFTTVDSTILQYNNYSNVRSFRFTEALLSPNTFDLEMAIGPFYKLRVYLFMRQLSVDRSMTAYLLPFDDFLWIFVGLWVVVSSVSFLLLNWIYSKFKREEQENQTENLELIFAPVFTLCGQDVSGLLDTASQRIILMTTTLAAMFLMMYYSCFLLSYLMISNPRLPYNSIPEILKEGKHEIGSLLGSFEGMVVQRKYGNPHARGPFTGRVVLPFGSLYDASLRVCINKSAFIGLRDTVLSASPGCVISKLEKPVATTLVGFTMVRMDLRRFFREKFVTFHEIGVINKILINIEGQSMDGDYNDEEFFDSVNWEQIFPIQILLGLVTLPAVVILAAELSLYYRRKLCRVKKGV